MPCPSHPPRLDHSNYAWRRVQAMKSVRSLIELVILKKSWIH
jgi:hypothetical protein